MSIEDVLSQGFVTEKVDNVVNWTRTGSPWPMAFGLACCAPTAARMALRPVPLDLFQSRRQAMPPEKARRTEPDPQAPQNSPERRQQPGARGALRSQKALDKSGAVNREKLEENQRRLEVGKDHKTAGMKKGHRGTFP